MELRILPEGEPTDLGKRTYDASHPEHTWQIKSDLDLAERRRIACDAWAKRNYRELGTCRFCARKGYLTELGVEAKYDNKVHVDHPLGWHSGTLSVLAICSVRGCRDRDDPKVLISRIDPTQF